MTVTVPELLGPFRDPARIGAAEPLRIPAGWIGQPRLLAGLATGALAQFDDHLAVHGPQPERKLTELLALLDAVALTGRGGAGFPVAAKLRALRPGPSEVVVNGAEGEPASAKDTVLLTQTPHLVLDGAVAVGHAIGARGITVAVTSPAVEACVRAAVTTRPDRARFTVIRVPDRFVVGEARALLRVLDGGPPLPPGRRVHPTDHGLGGRPTMLSNAETFAQLAVLTRLGAERFAAVDGSGFGSDSGEPGTVLLTVTGAVGRPGVLEVPAGFPLAAVAEATKASAAQAVVIGGYHGLWHRPDFGIGLSRAELTARGSTLGAGVIAFVGADTCALGELTRVAGWLASESAKQCGPCSFGLPSLVADLTDALAGHDVVDRLLRRADTVAGRGACAHPDGAVRFVSSGLRLLGYELAAHRSGRGCGKPIRGQLPLTRSAAFGGAR